MTRSLSDTPGEKRPFAVLPVRALSDKSMSDTDRRVLGALGYYANRAGVCWPSSESGGAVAGCSDDTFLAACNRLEKASYIRKLNPNNYDQRKGQWGYSQRYQILWTGNDPLPTYEEIKSANLMQPMADRDQEEGSGARGVDEDSVRRISIAYQQAIETVVGVQPNLAALTFHAGRMAEAGVEPWHVGELTRIMQRTAAANRLSVVPIAAVADEILARTNVKRTDGVCTTPADSAKMPPAEGAGGREKGPGVGAGTLSPPPPPPRAGGRHKKFSRKNSAA